MTILNKIDSVLDSIEEEMCRPFPHSFYGFVTGMFLCLITGTLVFCTLALIVLSIAFAWKISIPILLLAIGYCAYRTFHD